MIIIIPEQKLKLRQQVIAAKVFWFFSTLIMPLVSALPAIGTSRMTAGTPASMLSNDVPLTATICFGVAVAAVIGFLVYRMYGLDDETLKKVLRGESKMMAKAPFELTPIQTLSRHWFLVIGVCLMLSMLVSVFGFMFAAFMMDWKMGVPFALVTAALNTTIFPNFEPIARKAGIPMPQDR